MADIEQLIKTKQRVTDHSEVFTPSHIVEEMLDLVADEAERIDSRFLEPACGEGNFLRQVLFRKLATVQTKYGQSEFERRHYGLLCVMCIYGMELLEDNAVVCRQNLVEIFSSFIGEDEDEEWTRAAQNVMDCNIIQADALTMRKADGASVVFPEWGYLGKGLFQKRDFRFETLVQRSSFSGTLFAGLESDEMFSPVASYKPMSMRELAKGTVF